MSQTSSSIESWQYRWALPFFYPCSNPCGCHSARKRMRPFSPSDLQLWVHWLAFWRGDCRFRTQEHRFLRLPLDSLRFVRGPRDRIHTQRDERCDLPSRPEGSAHRETGTLDESDRPAIPTAKWSECRKVPVMGGIGLRVNVSSRSSMTAAVLDFGIERMGMADSR